MKNILTKYLPILFLLSSCSSPSINTRINDSNLDEGLVLYLPFEDNANDSSEFKKQGKINGPLSFVAGKIGKAGYFKGSEENQVYIMFENNEKISLKKAFTISAWVNPEILEARTYYPIVTKGKEKEDYTMWLTPGGVDLLLNWSTENEFWPHQENEKKSEINEKKWLFLTVTYDGSKVNLYNDGILNKSLPFNKEVDNSNEDLYVGLSFPGALENFTGAIDELRIYERTLSEGEIKALMSRKD